MAQDCQIERRATKENAMAYPTDWQRDQSVGKRTNKERKRAREMLRMRETVREKDLKRERVREREREGRE